MIRHKPIPKNQKKSNQKLHRIDQLKNFLHKRSILLIIVLIITFIAFLPSLSNQFINTWDDNNFVINNPLITHLNWESIKGFFTTQNGGAYVPLPLLTWAVEFKFFGLNPFPYHLDNLLLHLICTLLVFYFFNLLRLPVIYAAFGALLFGIHPMHVESVAWVTERKDLLFCLFYLGSLITYTKFILSENRKLSFFLLTLLLFIFSLFSKIQAVSLPFSLFLLDYWFDRSLRWKLIFEKIPFFVFSLIFGLGGYFILQNLGVINIHDKYTLFERILAGLYSFSAYIVKLVAPLNLSAFYPYPVDPGASIPLLYYLNLAFLLVMSVLIFLTFKKTKVVIFGFLFFLFNVVFLLQVVRAGDTYQADRYTYVPYIGLFFLAAWGAHKFASRNSSSQMVVAGLVLIVTTFFFSNTYGRCKDWKNGITLWNDVIEKFPQKIPTAYYSRGIEYGDLGQWDKAIDDYSIAIEIDPKFSDAYSNRGVAYGNLGLWDKAIDDYKRAIEIDPKISMTYSDCGIAYGNLGQWDKAISNYNKAIEIDPKFTQAYSNRGIAYANLGQFNEAISDFSKAIEIDPKFVEAYSNRGIAYRNLRQYEKSITEYSKAIEIDPKYKNAYYNRGIAYMNLGQWGKAISDFSRAIEIDPAYSMAYFCCGIAYGNLGQWVKSIANYTKAIEIDPKFVEAYSNRGVAYGKLGQWDKALSDFSKAIEMAPNFTEAYTNREIAYKKLHIEIR
jgi:tetratricopeptide (TPR) repeat protein